MNKTPSYILKAQLAYRLRDVEKYRCQKRFYKWRQAKGDPSLTIEDFIMFEAFKDLCALYNAK
jgi:hypothetical protein